MAGIISMVGIISVAVQGLKLGGGSVLCRLIVLNEPLSRLKEKKVVLSTVDGIFLATEYKKCKFDNFKIVAGQLVAFYTFSHA